jgi:heme-degrading monooxygenase HmoA
VLRVLYHWNVEPQDAREFGEAWAEVTLAMRRTHPGARGSALMQSRSDERLFVAMAEWTSLAEWQATRGATPAAPAAEERMKKSGRFVRFELLELCRDLIVRDPDSGV